MKRLRYFLLYLFPPLLWMGLIFWWSSIPNLELQGELAPWDLVLRKLAHIIEYAILAILVYRSLNYRRWHLMVGGTFIVSLLYAVFDEIHQYLVPTRDGKVTDVLIDTIGIILGLWFYGKLTQGPTLSIDQ